MTDEGTLDQLSFELYAANSMISGVPFRAYAKSEFVHSTRLYSRWVSWGRFLPAHARHASLIPSLHDHASDCFAALSECKTRSGRSIVVVCFGLKAIFMIADCYRVAIQTRLCNEILGITSVFLRK